MEKIPESELVLNKDGSIYHLHLRPHHISDTILTVRDPGQVYMISKYFDDIDYEINRREFITHTGTYKGKQLTVMSTGMGADNVEVLMTEVDALANINLKKRIPGDRLKKLKIIRIGTSAALQEDIPVGTHLISDYAVGLDTLMNFYNLAQSDFERQTGAELQRVIKLPFAPYVARGSQHLRKQWADSEMIIGNTVTCPGFYAPQGRKLRAELKNNRLLQVLSYYHKNDFWLTNFDMETAAYYAFGNMLGHDVLSVNAIIFNRIKNQFSGNPQKVLEGLVKKVLDRIVSC